MSDLRKLSEAATPGEWEAAEYVGESWWVEREIRRADGQSVIGWTADIDDDALIVALVNEFRSGSLIPRSEYERVLALLAEAREALEAFRAYDEQEGESDVEMMLAYAKARDMARATLSRIDDALAAQPEAKA